MLSSPAALADLIGLRVADLSLWLDTRGSGIDVALPACHTQFLRDGLPDGGLVLYVRDGTLPSTEGWHPIHDQSETWQLWQDERGRYIFVAPEVCPPRRHVVVDPDFAAGEVIGEFALGTNVTPAVYPLQNLEIKVFANWLAGFGDLVLHAVGIDLGGAGYCFAGRSGAGKSTLAAALMAAGGATMLGDDNLALRYLEDRFRIFGTPWHQDPARCSPHGAPLERFFFLDRNGDPGVKPLKPVDGIARLLQTAFIPYYRQDAMPTILERLSLLAEAVPFYTLSYRLGDDVMALIREA